ncbi:chemotaxis protein CheW [Methanococcoides methylutens]|uniref:chemotaxis protein CheW n=1 Tax=Methanococcoides methylutens TaxID=2226 RepID=UPI001082EEE0|nr:chemotaxis protein CheW [Methanococcoides methylutens]
MQTDMDAYKDDFLQEVNEYLEIFNQSFVDLENGDNDALDEIFRVAHTIKGMAGFLGYASLEKLCHSMEEVLSGIKCGDIVIDSDLIDIMLSTVDRINEMVEKIESEGNDEIKIDNLLNAFDMYKSQKDEEVEDRIPEESTSAIIDTQEAEDVEFTHREEDVSAVTGSLETEDLNSENEDGEPNLILNVKIAPDSDIKELKAILVIESLKEAGHVIRTEPTEEEIDSTFKGSLKAFIKGDAGKVEDVMNKISEIDNFEVISCDQEEHNESVDSSLKKDVSSVVRSLETEDMKSKNEGAEHNLILNVKLAPDSDIKELKAILVIESLKEAGHVIRTEPTEEEIDSTFKGSLIAFIKGDAGKVEDVMNKISEIDNFEVISCDQEENEENVDSCPLEEAVSETSGSLETEDLNCEKGDGGHNLILNVKLAPDSDIKELKAILVIESLKEAGYVIRTEPTEEEIDSTFKGSLKAFIKGDAGKVEDVMNKISEIDNFEIISCEQEEVTEEIQLPNQDEMENIAQEDIPNNEGSKGEQEIIESTIQTNESMMFTFKEILSNENCSLQEKLRKLINTLFGNNYSGAISAKEIIQDEEASLMFEESILEDESSLISEEIIQEDESPLMSEEIILEDEVSLISEESIQKDEVSLISEESIQKDEVSLVSEESIQKDEVSLMSEESIQEDESPLMVEEDIQKEVVNIRNIGSNQDNCTAKQDTTKKGSVGNKRQDTIRVRVSNIDSIMNLVGELVINKGCLLQISQEHRIPELEEATAILDKSITSLQDEVMMMRMVKIEKVFKKFPRMVRDLSRKFEKDIGFEIEGQETELDRTILDEISDPLVHLVRNCVDHGIETPEERAKAGKSQTGHIKLSAKREKSNVIIEIEDDGKGLDLKKIKNKALEKGIISSTDLDKLSEDEIRMLIFTSGLSTKDSATEISGRGVGMDAVKTTVEKLGGKIKIYSQNGKGTKMRINLPPTVAIIKSLVVESGNETYAIPISNVVEALDVNKDNFKLIRDQPLLYVREKLLPAIRLKEFFDIGEYGKQLEKEVGIIVERESEEVALLVDSIIDQQEIVIKPLGSVLSKVKGFIGVTILGDGRVIPILDVSALVGGDIDA